MIDACNALQYLHCIALRLMHEGSLIQNEQQTFETAEALINQIETEVNQSVVNLSKNDLFKRIISDIIGFRTVRVISRHP